MKRYLFLLPVLSCLSVNLHAEEFVEWVGANSGVNWSAGQIQAEGAGAGPENAPPAIARMMACRAAVVDAQRNLLESISGVRVEGNTIVANMMVESDIVKTSVSGLLQGARVIKRDALDDGSCIVQMTAPLGGRFATDMYQQVFEGEALTSIVPGLNAQPTAAFENVIIAFINDGLNYFVPRAKASESVPWQDAIDQLSMRINSLEDLISTHPSIVEVKDTGPTGLVLDARGSNFIPSMSPNIRQIREGIIYPDKKHRETRKQRGQLVSLFTRDLGTAQRHPTVGERPIVLKALRTWGKTRTDIVLGSASSEQLMALVKNGFLNDSGVIIVL